MKRVALPFYLVTCIFFERRLECGALTRSNVQYRNLQDHGAPQAMDREIRFRFRGFFRAGWARRRATICSSDANPAWALNSSRE